MSLEWVEVSKNKTQGIAVIKFFNPFHATDLFWYLLKT